MTLVTDISGSRLLPAAPRAQVVAAPSVLSHRLPALDWMRGLVMILMVTDHASASFNAARPTADGAALYAGEALSAVDFLYRWISPLCAPAFLFLAGASLALSIERKRARGGSAWSIDRDLLIRGGLVLSVDLLLISFLKGDSVVLQVMYAIGISMMAMTILRRMPTTWLLAFGLGVFLLTESLLGADWRVDAQAGAIANGDIINFTPGTP